LTNTVCLIILLVRDFIWQNPAVCTLQTPHSCTRTYSSAVLVSLYRLYPTTEKKRRKLYGAYITMLILT